MLRKFIFLPLCWSVLTLDTSQAILIQGYDEDRHNRFEDSSEFLGNEFDLSGVGRVSTGGAWATMISPSYFLSATHLHAPTNETIRFYETNNMSGAFIDRTVESGVRIAGSDLWLGKLSSPVTSQIATYPILEPINLIDQLIYVVGQGPGEPTGMRVGRNKINRVVSDFSDPELGISQGDIFTFDYDTANGLGQDESRTQGGDSGGPSFAAVDGELAILGIHWFIYEIEDEENEGLIVERGSGDTLVSSLITELQTAMVGESLRTVAIPEPAQALMFGLITVGVAVRRRRIADRG